MVLLLALSGWASSSSAASEGILVVGEYRYTYGDRESSAEAKNIAYTMAVRRAIESYQVFVESTTTVKDFQLIKDLVQIISSGYLKELKVLDHSQDGRTVYCKVQGYMAPTVIKNVVTRELGRIEGKEYQGLAENSKIRVLSVRESAAPTAESQKRVARIIYKALANFDGRAPDIDIVIDMFDSEGNPLPGQRHAAIETQEYLNEGEVREVRFIVPADTRSYKVRVMP